MPASKKGESTVSDKTKTVTLSNGKTFTIQRTGAMWYLQHSDNCRGANGQIQQSKYIPGLLRNCIIEQPKIEDFDDDFAALEELVGEVESFLRNKPL
jgi:hypothetical protein